MKLQLVCPNYIRLEYEEDFDDYEEAEERDEEPEKVDAVVIEHKWQLLKVKSIEELLVILRRRLGTDARGLAIAVENDSLAVRRKVSW